MVDSVVAAGTGRSQSDNYYVTITDIYGPHRAPNLPDGRRRTQFFAGGGKGPSHPAGRQPGGQTSRRRARRTAVRPLVEERNPHGRLPCAAELRAASRAPG